MRHAVVIDAARTPIGRASAENGYYRDVRAEDLSAGVLRALVSRTGIDPKLIGDVRWGCVQQFGEQGYDIARIAALAAELPVETGGVTVNRNCASSLQAINDAALSIAAGMDEAVLAGGVEHMEHIPMSQGYNPYPGLFKKHGEGVMNMGLTAEYLARKYRVARNDQDAYALRSHSLSAAATDRGDFRDEILPTWGRDESGRKVRLTADQCIRRETSAEALAALSPAFDPSGSVTAGNSSPMSVGASGVLLMAEDQARALGLKPMARVKSMAVVGVHPEEMGVGPVPAVRKALERAGLSLDQIDCVEINEAFAVQVLVVQRLLGINPDRLNTRGGAIAIGHPLGASGARIVTTLLHRMRAEGGRLGLAALCVGMGQGVATVFEACQD